MIFQELFGHENFKIISSLWQNQIFLHGFSFPLGVFIFLIFQKAMRFAIILSKGMFPRKENFNLISYS